MDDKEYYKQNASGLYLEVQKIGCFFRAACHMAELEAERQGKRITRLTIDEINRCWEFSQKLKYINDELNVVTSAPIANLAGSILGLKGKFVEVATFKAGQMNWYGSIPKDQRRADYFIQRIAQNGPSKIHFINVTKEGKLLWDPHDPDITVQGVYYTICYKYQEA